MTSLREQATDAMKKGQYLDAVDIYTRLMSDSKSKHVLLSNRSKAYFDAGHYTQAASDARACIKLQPTYQKGMWRLAKATSALGEHEEAFRAYLAIIRCKGVRETIQKLDVSGPAISALMSHIRQQGGTITSCAVAKDTSNVRGVIMLEKVRTGTDVIRVPYDALLTENAGRATSWGRDIVGKTNMVAYDFVLHLIFAVVQRMIQDPNDPYIVSLPSDYTYMSAFWNEREFAMLRGSHIIEQVQKRQRFIRNEYAFLKANVPDFVDKCPFERYAHFRTMVCSRNFTFRRHGQQERALVPMADLLNHSGSPNTNWLFDDKSESFCVRAASTILVGTTLTDSYGKRNNATLMSVYGFALHNNPYDYVHCAGLYLFRNPELVAAKDHFNEIRATTEGDSPLKREVNMLQDIRAKAARQMMEYTHSRQDDVNWLEKNTELSVERFMRIATLSEKNILKAWIDIVNECLRIRSPRQHKRAKRRWKRESNGERIYLKYFASL